MAKARGVKLGNPNGAEALMRAGKGALAGCLSTLAFFLLRNYSVCDETKFSGP